MYYLNVFKKTKKINLGFLKLLTLQLLFRFSKIKEVEISFLRKLFKTISTY